MIQITRWKPDTCKCIIEYEWDDSVPADQREHTLKTIQRCPDHMQHAKPAAFQVVTDENKRKNRVHALIMENFPDLVEEGVNPEGETFKRLKKGIEFNWEFDANRKLKVDLKGATNTHKSQLMSLINNGFGTNKVEVI